MIKIKNLNKIYKSRKSSHHALKDINLDFADSGLNFILGKSGCVPVVYYCSSEV